MNLKQARRLSKTDRPGSLCARAALINHCDTMFDESISLLEQAREALSQNIGTIDCDVVDSITEYVSKATEIEQESESMPEYYCTSASRLNVENDFHYIVSQAISTIKQDIRKHKSYTPIGFEVDFFDDYIVIYEEDYFIPEHAAMLILLLLGRLNYDHDFEYIMSWAYTCSSMEPDAFSGGACSISINRGIVYSNPEAIAKTKIQTKGK